MTNNALAMIAARLEDHEARLRAVLNQLGATPDQIASLDLDVIPDVRAFAAAAGPDAIPIDVERRARARRAGAVAPPGEPRGHIAGDTAEVGTDPHPPEQPDDPEAGYFASPDHYTINRADDDGADPEPGDATYETGQPARGAVGEQRRGRPRPGTGPRHPGPPRGAG